MPGTAPTPAADPARPRPAAPADFRPERPWSAASSSHPAVSLDMGDTDRLRFVAASIIGSGHVTSRLPREDAYAARGTETGVVACVADGISSASGSRVIAAGVSDIVIGDLAATAGAGEWGDRCRRALDQARRYASTLADSPARGRTDTAVLGTADLDRHARAATTLAVVEATWLPAGLHVDWLVLGDTEVLHVTPGQDGVHRLSHDEQHLHSDAPDRIGVGGIAGRPRTGSSTLPPGSWVLLGSDGSVDGPLGEHGRLLEDLLLGGPGSTDRLAWALLRILLAPVQAAHDDRTVVLIGPGTAGGLR